MAYKPTYEELEQRVRELENNFVKLKPPQATHRELEHMKLVEEDLLWEVEANASITELARKLIMPNSIKNISSLVLDHAKGLTKSHYGYVGYIDLQTGYLVKPAVTGGNADRLKAQEKNTIFKARSGPWGWVLNNRKPLVTNTPADETELSGNPFGHIPIKRFLSVPALIEEKLVGQISLANSERDYSERDLLLVKRLAVFYALAIQRSWSEKALRKAKAKLEGKVLERTKQISKANEKLQAEINIRELAEKEMKIAKNTAEAANNAKSEFLANMSHELRTPLNHIMGFTELVVDKNFGDLNEQQEEYLNHALDSSRHLLALINDILDLSKVEAGKLELDPSDINIAMLLKNSLVMIKEKAIKNDLQVFTDMDSAPDTIKADKRKLKQIIYNLLSNAVKFTPEDGSIKLAAYHVLLDNGHLRRSDGREIAFPITNGRSSMTHRNLVEISVKDTGIGIKPEDLDRIFKPFEQVESSENRRFNGTGLGLSLTKRLVELHGGRIWAESEGENKGSTFRFVIPV